MSKLNGMQIFELMSDMNDELIAESSAAALLVGSAAVGTAALAGSTAASASAAAPKAGFGAWLAKGGWVALTAGIVAVAGITAGLLVMNHRNNPSDGTLPPVSETVADSLDTESPTEPEETTAEVSSETLAETTAEDSVSITEEVTMPDTSAEETADETTAEAETQAPLSPLPLRISDFSDVDLSLFTTGQGKVSVTSEGKLMLAADWDPGDYTNSSATWVPHALMPYAPAYAESAPYTPGAIVMKYRVVNGDNGQPDFYFKGAGDSDAQATYTHATVYEDWGSEYRYLIIRTDSVSSYMNGEQPTMTMGWIHLGNNFSTCDGRYMTIEEMIFYPSTTQALLGFGEYLEENGVVTEILYSNNDVGYRIVYSNPQYASPVLHIPSYAPDGVPVKEITNDAYTGNTFLFALTVDEGMEYIRYDAFERCSSLVTAYLPDSLVYLDRNVFSGCSALTEIHLGSGLRAINRGALPLSSEAFTDIYYNGTVADWYRVTRWDTTANHAITVHCTDGELDYSDAAPAVLPGVEDEVRDLAEILAEAPPMTVEENETLISCEARVIRLKQGKYGEYKEFILRYGVFQREYITRYGFDILSMGGSIVAEPTYAVGMLCRYDAGGMVYFEDAPSGEMDAMVFLYRYGLDTNGNLAYSTLHYNIELEEDGTLKINSYYPGSPELTEAGYMDKRLSSRDLLYSIRVLDTLDYDVTTRRFGALGYHLVSSAPDGTVTLFSPANAPLFDLTLPATLRDMKLSEVLTLGIPAFYETYAPRKRE